MKIQFLPCWLAVSFIKRFPHLGAVDVRLPTHLVGLVGAVGHQSEADALTSEGRMREADIEDYIF